MYHAVEVAVNKAKKELTKKKKILRKESKEDLRLKTTKRSIFYSHCVLNLDKNTSNLICLVR